MFSTGSLNALAEEYFQSLSPICSRVIEDIESVRISHQDKWLQLNYEEKDQLIGEFFIKNDAKQKYTCYPHSKPDYESFPRLSIRSGEKYIVDDESQGKSATGHTWRDEHSGPFSWETQSQLDLSFTDDKKQKRSTQQLQNQQQQQVKLKTNVQTPKHGCFLETFCPCNKEATAVETKPKAPKPPPRKPNCAPPPPIPAADKEKEILCPKETKKPETASYSLATEEIELKPKKEEIEERYEEELEDPNIPRTGFDFLDNW